MPSYCMVVKCSSNSLRESLGFFRIPSIYGHNNKINSLAKERRDAWIQSLRRKDLTDTKLKNGRICSKHFITGKPAKLTEKNNPDWVPSVNMGYRSSSSSTESADDIYENLEELCDTPMEEEIIVIEPICSIQEDENDDVLDNTSHNEKPKKLKLELQSQYEEKKKLLECQYHTKEIDKLKLEVQSLYKEKQKLLVCQSRNEELERLKLEAQGLYREKQKWLECQSRHKELESLKLEVQSLYTDKQKLLEKTKKLEFDVDRFKSDDELTSYYTSFPEHTYVNAVFELVEDKLSTVSALTKFKQLILTLMKLKLNFQFKDLGYRFQIHHTTASRIFYKTVNVLYERLKSSIIWPERENLKCNVPKSFQQNFGSRVTVIVDCFEVSIEKPSNPDAACETFFDNKTHYTIKYLIGITPQGTISFISKAYGGEASDKFITKDCGILSNLLPGDLVLADRGFRIHDSESLCFAQEVTPLFVKGKIRLNAKEVKQTREIAAIKTHIKRVNGLLKQKYTIFRDTLPLVAAHKKDDELTLIDKLIVICCAFINMSPPIVPLV